MMSEPRARIRVTYKVRDGLNYLDREGYDFQWVNDDGLVSVVQIDETGNPVWIEAFMNVETIEWTLLDPERSAVRPHVNLQARQGRD